MKKSSFVLFLLFNLSRLLAQPAPDLAGVFEVREKAISIRWAAGTVEIFRAGVQYGYKIERLVSNDPKKDSLIQFVKPWSAADTRWNKLKKENKNTGLVYNILYKNIGALSKEKKEMLFGLTMKTCDLYPEIAKACGLFISDSLFSANEVYTYRISLWNSPASIKYTPLLLIVDTKSKTKLANLTPVKVKFGDKCSYITIYTKGLEDYAGFQIERSADSINYVIVNQAPLISVVSNSTNNEIIYKDSLPENNHTYYYRAKGVTFFGSLSDPSEVISGKGKPAFKEYPHIDSATVIGNKYVRLKFRMPATFDTKQLKGYVVLRSTQRKGKYLAITQGLLSREADHYTDEKPEVSSYYKICAINAYGDSSFSFSSYAKLADDVPPLPPQELKGAIDTSGIVNLQWKANSEPDLLGYRVFRCNTEKERPVELTKTLLKDPKFSDRIELKTLTKSVYYTIRAVDKTYNNSAYGIFCSLKRPDKIAPAEPVFKKTACSDSSILIAWIPSSSQTLHITNCFAKWTTRCGVS